MAIFATRRKWLVTSLCAAARSPCLRQRLASRYSSCRSSIGKPPESLKITGEARFGRQASIRDRQPNHGLHRIIRNGSSLSPKTTFETKLSESDRLVNLISKHYYLSKRRDRDHVSTRNGRAPAPGGTARAGRGL